ncbi:MAG: glycosyltransferase family 4 protein [Chloroflexi bacterium]|nr:glycosyltransferase family 4 protein [Chloroflexota bacterium]
MKILMAVHHFPPRYKGGAEWETHRRANALQARGHQVRVVSVERIDAGPEQGVSWEDDEFDGVKVRRLSFKMAAAPDPFRWEYDNLWIGDHLSQLITEDRPDIFHLISGYLMSGRALLAARELGIPSLVSLTDFWFLCRRITMLRSDGSLSTLPISPMSCARCLGEEKRRYSLPNKFAPGLMDVFWQTQKKEIGQFEARMNFLKKALSQVNGVISPSRFLQSVYVDWGVPQEKIFFSRQGRDFPDLPTGALGKKPSDTLRVGYLGQVTHLKGVHVLIEAVKRLPNLPISLEVHGDLSHFPHYVSQLRQLIGNDSRIRLAGPYNRRSELTRVMQNLDVTVVPSLWYENSPNVILESFAHQTPVLASDMGGMSELVQEGVSGLLFKLGDAGDLARKLRWLLDEPDLLVKLRAGIRPTKTVAQEMDQLEAVYCQIVGGGPIQIDQLPQ